MTIQAITFDFWRTLFRHVHSEERRGHRVDVFCAATAANRDRVDEAMKVAEDEFTRAHTTLHRTLGPDEAVRIMANHLKIRLSPEVEARLALEFAKGILMPPPPVIEGAVDAVRKAAERYPVGIISDTGFSPGKFLRSLLADHGILDVFKVLVFSDEVGVSKPQSPMFEAAIRGFGIQPNELLHIGDLEWTDIVGAREFGATAVLYAGDNDRYVQENTAHYVLCHWNDFGDILDSLEAPSAT